MNGPATRLRRFFFAPLRLCVSSFFVLLFFSASPADPSPARLVYKNPLDVTVDEKGETARVVLTGPRTVAVVDLKAGRVVKEEPWPADKRLPEAGDQSYSLEGVRWSQATTYVSEYHLRAYAMRERIHLAVYQIPKSELPATQVSQGWIFSNAFAFLEPRNSGRMLLLPLDDARRAYSDLSDAEILPNERWAAVASAGGDVILVIDLTRARSAIEQEKVGVVRITYDQTTSRPFVSARLPTQSNPRRLGLSGDGKTLVVSNFLSDSLTVIDTEKLKVVKHIALDGPKPDAARRGEILFNSAKLTQFGQFTCASCHPNGGADGLNWDLPRDGIGNPKNTKSLLGIKDTAPYGWLGTSATLADRVRGTLRTLHRYEPGEEEVSDLVAYLETLEAPAHAKPQAAEREMVERGKTLFEGKAGCVTCHSGPTLQDGRQHNVGTGTIEGEDRFDTPSLRGVRLTAPYLHDGRAATLADIFTKYNTKKQHGAADGLTAEELVELVAYLKCL